MFGSSTRTIRAVLGSRYRKFGTFVIYVTYLNVFKKFWTLFETPKPSQNVGLSLGVVIGQWLNHAELMLIYFLMWFSIQLHYVPMSLPKIDLSLPWAFWSWLINDWIVTLLRWIVYIYCYLRQLMTKDPCGSIYEDVSMRSLVINEINVTWVLNCI